ncbi:MAG: DUF3137 domain-containing protein [Micromonosporaceae bacterium]
MEAVAGSLVCFGFIAAGIGLIVFLVVMVVRHQREVYRKRVAALFGWARAHGWTYLQADPTLVKRFTGEPFGRGSGRQANHVLYGNHRGHQVLAFEYQFTVSNGQDSSTTYRYTVVTLATPAPRPYLQVGHEHTGHKLLELVGVRDLQLESEEFNRVFRISAGDDRFAYAVLDPRMMEWLLADQRARSTPFRFESNALLCWSRTGLDPRYVIWMADYLVDIVERVPAFVWR